MPNVSDILKTPSGEDVLFFKGEPKDGDGLEFYTTYVNSGRSFSDSNLRVLSCCNLRLTHPVIVKCSIIEDDGSFGYCTYRGICNLDPANIFDESFRKEFVRAGLPKYGDAKNFMLWAKHHTDADGVIFVNMVEGDSAFKVSLSDRIPAYVCCVWNTGSIVGKRRIIKKFADKYLNNILKRLDLTAFGFNEEFHEGVLNRKILNDGCFVEDRFEITGHSLEHFQHVVIPHGFDPEKRGVQFLTNGSPLPMQECFISDTQDAYDINISWDYTIQRVELAQPLEEKRIPAADGKVFRVLT